MVTPIYNVSEIHTRLVNKSVEEILKISADNVRRKDVCEETDGLLEQGVYNPTEYYFLLESKNKITRLEELKEVDAYFHGYASPDHFDMVPENESVTMKKVCTFVVKKGALPSDAVHAMKKGLSLIGCGEACQLAQYLAIEDVWKPEKFNFLLSADSTTPLVIGSRLPQNPLSRLRNYMKMPISPDSPAIEKADHIYVTNANTYLDKQITGSSKGYNVFCIDKTIGSQKFTTLGLPPGATHRKIEDICISKYNSLYRSMETWSENTFNEVCAQLTPETFDRAQEMMLTQIDYKEFKAQNGGSMMIVGELDANRITAIANASLEKARQLFDGYDVRSGPRIAIS